MKSWGITAAQTIPNDCYRLKSKSGNKTVAANRKDVSKSLERLIKSKSRLYQNRLGKKDWFVVCEVLLVISKDGKNQLKV